MNRLEILSMEAGVELDELVAEEVIGHQKPNFFPPNALELCLAGDAFHIPSWTCVCVYEENDTPKWVPDLYSMDISAAFQVVDTMLGNGFSLELIVGADGNTLAHFFDASQIIPDDRSNQIICESVPEAICKAALLTKAV